MRPHSRARSRIAAIQAAGLLLPGVAAAQQTGVDISAELRTARQVLESPRLGRAFGYLAGARDETIQEWLSLCNAYAPSGQEGQRSRLLYKLFRIYGLQNVRIDDALNVIGERPGAGDGPIVVLNAHHDNVQLWPEGQAVEAFVADGRIWCPAAGDDLMGVVQMLTLLRALNAADVRTAGDIWFVGLTGEEAPTGPIHPDASPGAGHFVRSNLGRNLDWKRGDILLQFHGGGGDGVSTGSTPMRNRSHLRVFTSFERDRWAPHTVDALGRIISRITTEVRDPRSTRLAFPPGSTAPTPEDVLYMNMAMIGASEIISRPASEAWIRFDMRADHQRRIDVAHDAIERVTREVLAEFSDAFTYTYEVNSRNGVEEGVPGFEKTDNPAARMAAAAAQALYGGDPIIDSTTGCGDCVRAYATGMPALSLRGSVLDHLDGTFDVVGGRGELASPVRRATAGHDVTESAEISRLWAGVKHGLLFALSYVGLVN